MTELFRTATGRLAVVAVAAGFACATSASAALAQPTGEILGAGGTDAIPNRYIVSFADEAMAAQNVHTTIDSLTERYGGEVQHEFTSVLRGYSVIMDEQSAKRLAAENEVGYVEQAGVVRAAGEQQDPPSWGIDRVDQAELPLDQLYTYEGTGEGVVTYGIDSGVYKDHPDFEGRASYGPDLINGDDESKDDYGHGTHIAGTIMGATYGVAKEAEHVAIKVLDQGGSGPDDTTIEALDWIVENGQTPGVINMSITADERPHQAMNEATDRASEAGFLSAAAAGNDSSDACSYSPASASTALSVGATSENDNRATFSNIGECVDLFAPGDQITSASHTGEGGTSMSGTSMAAPHAAGAAAVYFGDNPETSVQEAHDALVGAATEGVVQNPGSGSPNLLLFTGGGS